MQITISQDELEVAVTTYLRSMGITGEISGITFTQTRSPTAIQTTIELGSMAPTRPTAVEAPAEAEPEAPTEETDGEVAEAPHLKTVSDGEIPFEPDPPKAAEASEEAEPSGIPAGKSLFG